MQYMSISGCSRRKIPFVAIFLQVSMSLKTNKDQPSVVDADWLSSDMPLLLLSDRSMRVLHATMRTSNSPIADKDLEGKETYQA